MSLTAKTVNYALTHMPKLARYVNDDRFRPDNNDIEEVIRSLKVGLNNYGTATITTPQLKGIAPNDFAKLHRNPARAGSVNKEIRIATAESCFHVQTQHCLLQDNC